MSDNLESLNTSRTDRFRKKSGDESFLEEFNQYLHAKEKEEYRSHPPEYPFIFVIGPPRSGTTLTSQLIANTLDVGYINNLAARFYLAPLHGIRFSKAVLGDRNETDFTSTYAKTSHLSDIHEFGYFWRHWLKKESLEDIARSEEQEDEIDWNGLKQCLVTLQHEMGKGMVFKNIFGSYHLPRLQHLLEKVLVVYVERDELDTACSILEARKQYYGDNLEKWWSYAPPEVLSLKELGYRRQIAGQIVYLRRFFRSKFEHLQEGSVIRVRYEAICKDPQSLLDTIRQQGSRLYNHDFSQIRTAPGPFEVQTYDSPDTKKLFEGLIKEFRTQINAS